MKGLFMKHYFSITGIIFLCVIITCHGNGAVQECVRHQKKDGSYIYKLYVKETLPNGTESCIVSYSQELPEGFVLEVENFIDTLKRLVINNKGLISEGVLIGLISVINRRLDLTPYIGMANATLLNLATAVVGLNVAVDGLRNAPQLMKDLGAILMSETRFKVVKV